MENFFETIMDLKRSAEPFSLAIIVKTEGSTPRRVGVKMIIMKDGKTKRSLFETSRPCRIGYRGGDA
jgi:xanthine/CO dehydrogenase XdhC/CoxF family maturation factor